MKHTAWTTFNETRDPKPKLKKIRLTMGNIDFWLTEDCAVCDLPMDWGWARITDTGRLVHASCE